eukprot:scaffold7225_cov83-Skeletonema_menzelii.AAC.1
MNYFSNQGQQIVTVRRSCSPIIGQYVNFISCSHLPRLRRNQGGGVKLGSCAASIIGEGRYPCRNMRDGEVIEEI